MNNTLLDNSLDFRMVEYIKDMLCNTQCSELKIATGYWDLPGTKLIYNELKSFLDRGGSFDLLIGQEPIVRSYMLDENTPKEEKFPDFYFQRDVDRFRDEYKDVVQLLTQYMNPGDEEHSQLRVHVYGQREVKQFLHAKCYIFLGRGFAHGIIGSSNFTQKGLEENAELNYLETENSVVIAPNSKYSNSKSHLTWFMEKWEDSEPWTGKFIEILTGVEHEKTTDTSSEVVIETQGLTPYEVYIRLLEDCFGVDDNIDITLIEYLDGTKYTKEQYQLDAVKQSYNIMLKMGGFLLADVVGLGKTIVGALVIRYYLEHSKKDDGSYNNVLVIVPPAIKSGWIDTINELDNANKPFKMSKHVDFVTTGSIASLMGEDAEDDTEALSFQKKDYGLIILDESHRFRNKGTQMYDSLDDLILSIRTTTGKSPFIGLVSATPQNNRPGELQNQISLFVPTPNSSQFSRIPNRDFDAYFSRVKKAFADIDPVLDKQKLIDLSNDIREKILNDIIVRRTRTDITTMYPGIIEFPTTVGPNVLHYTMSSSLAKLFSDSVEMIDPSPTTAGIGYHRYSAIARLTSPAHRKRYEGKNITVQATSDRLAKIMKLLLIKRLESSFDAFKESLENLGRYTQNMIDMWNDNTIFICPQLDVNLIMSKFKKRTDAYNDIRSRIAKLPAGKNSKGQNAEYKRSDFDANYINDLIADKKLIDSLLARWKKNTSDPKLDEFKAQLHSLMANDIARLDSFINEMKKYANVYPDTKDEINSILQTMEGLRPKLTDEKTKLVIFSEAIATADKIYSIATALGYRVLKVTAANRDKDNDVIAANFDANYKKEKKDDYDIIVTTEVLAEGVNLHRANAILNYDSPWNAARLIQRIGRVNRIGSQSKAVFVYNFFPSAQGNQEINLIQNAYRKLQAFHTQFGEDDKVFNPCEELSPAAFNTIVSGPASWQMKYMKELNDYKSNNPVRFQEIKAFAIPLRIAIKANPSETLCAIRNTSASNSFFVSVPADGGTANPLSMETMLGHCQCNETTPSVELSTDITATEQKAINSYTLLLQQRLKNITRPSKEIVESQRILATVWAVDSRFDSVRSSLNDARRLVDAGDKSIAKKIIKINADITSKQTTAVPYTADEIAGIIGKQMKDIADLAAKKYGSNSIFITFSK